VADVYTHAMWRVREGNEDTFIAKWSALADVFTQLQRKPLWGTLIRSAQDPRLFYSFGPWQDESDIAAMRADANAQAAFRELIALCDEATPSTYRVVRHVEP
jgi:quinol monooxygenase YgiN